jgi:RES domain-containing protein
VARLLRIARTVFVPNFTAAFNGEGAFRGGSRWNTPGNRMSFASTSQSLAQLEYLAHVDWSTTLHDDLTLVEGSLDDRFIDAVPSENLPPDWRQNPPSSSSAALGDAWISSGKSAGLFVPSALAPEERNVLLNPVHADFKHVRVTSMNTFSFDGRLSRKT